METDGGLRGLFRNHIPEFQWTSIETAATQAGVPDCEFCAPGGAQGWIENKKATHWKVKFETMQPSWHMQRARMGGRSFIAIRRKNSIKKGPHVTSPDELWLYRGGDVIALRDYGMREELPLVLGRWHGGPVAWDWDAVRKLLTE